jgi:hypothetical protein
MYKIFFLGLFAATLLLHYPQTASAYFTTAQSSLMLDKNHALFIVEYAFGLEKHDVYMPGVAKEGLLFENKEKKVGFTIKNEDGVTVTSGKTTAAIISKAPSVDGMYKLEKGKAQKMWLVAILETEKDTPTEKYKLQVESLPFDVDMNTKKDERKLNPSELQYYVTPAVKLNQK